MRRVVITALLVAAVAVVVIFVASGDDKSGTYQVRAIFENGSFIVQGEDVRVGGANVGSVESVDVTMPGETASLVGGKSKAIPGKAAVVLSITDMGFTDWKSDASCLIRPQSLIGEKFVECLPTQPRAAGSEPPPSLEQIPSGQTGAGEYLLPIENNGTAVDLDLINNIQRLPYAQRFRLIVNDLGAALAGRGSDLRKAVRRADPGLRETDQVLAILARQNRVLADLAVASDTSLSALARERRHITGFMHNAAISGEATAEKSAQLEQDLQKFPESLRQVRLTMNELGTFSDAAQPVISVLGQYAPSITKATEQLAPFAKASKISLISLGNTAEEAGPSLAAANPIVKQIRDVAKTGVSPTTNLAKFTGSLDRQGGFENLMRFIYNTGGTVNGFDQYGHYQRSNVLVSSCVGYVVTPQTGCSTNFHDKPATSARFSSSSATDLLDQSQVTPVAPATGTTGTTGATGDDEAGFLDYLLGP